MAARVAFIGDIVASKQIPNRSQVQQQLQDALDRLNHTPKQLSPYTITLGDEFQAVFASADSLLLDAISILVALHPVRIRFSFGLGSLDTPINPEAAIGMDGPAFHYARQGIEQLKGSARLFTVVGDQACIPLIQSTLSLISHIADKWQYNRWWILLRLYEETSVKTIADELDVSEQAVYKNIESGDLKTIIEIFKTMTDTLNQALRDS